MPGVLFAGGAVAAMIASALAAQGAPSALDTPESVPTEQIEISISTINGSGCPAGTAAVAPSADNTAFTVTYSDYLAQVGVGATPTDFRKNCQLNLDVHIPQGFTYAIASVDYRGYAYLADGASGLQQAQYYYQGSPETATSSTTFAGPYDDNWHTTDSTEYADLIWAPCGEDRNVNINTELRVYRGTSDTTKTTSLMTMDSTDGSVSTTYHLTWKEC
ncbi:DUF4360 domain-containing protein [Streptomyces hoynatensis]|uniref:DUF4360 domain-containing protein n=1 Tax=Streptomyces hoynatensis TaxID=1141874 RepID=A0A3A9Z6J8_9ACTN|nr:DUF4360 domain-containing protein [Streptomyces hoynatensis]RKN43893.1 DUF4360 domain-containing protein [Streptomyces hoynatensis]